YEGADERQAIFRRQVQNSEYKVRYMAYALAINNEYLLTLSKPSFATKSRNGLNTVTYFQLIKDYSNIISNRPICNMQLRSNFLCAFPFCNQIDDLLFAICQRIFFFISHIH